MSTILAPSERVNTPHYLSVVPPTQHAIEDEQAPPWDGQAPRERIRLMIVEQDVARAVCRDCGTAAAMYFLLETYADANGQCYPSYDTLAEGLDVTRRQAMRLVAKLEAAGYVSISERRTARRHNQSNLYTLPHHRKPRNGGGDTTGDISGDTTGDISGAPQSPKVVVSSSEVVRSNTGGEPPYPPPAKKPPKARPVSVPEDFSVTDEMRTQAQRYGLAPERIDFETDKFLDHFRSSGGKKIDWVAAWRNWMRRSSEERWSGARSSPSPNGAKPVDHNIIPHGSQITVEEYRGRWARKGAAS